MLFVSMLLNRKLVIGNFTLRRESTSPTDAATRITNSGIFRIGPLPISNEISFAYSDI